MNSVLFCWTCSPWLARRLGCSCPPEEGSACSNRRSDGNHFQISDFEGWPSWNHSDLSYVDEINDFDYYACSCGSQRWCYSSASSRWWPSSNYSWPIPKAPFTHCWSRNRHLLKSPISSWCQHIWNACRHQNSLTFFCDSGLRDLYTVEYQPSILKRAPPSYIFVEASAEPCWCWFCNLNILLGFLRRRLFRTGRSLCSSIFGGFGLFFCWNSWKSRSLVEIVALFWCRFYYWAYYYTNQLWLLLGPIPASIVESQFSGSIFTTCPSFGFGF